MNPVCCGANTSFDSWSFPDSHIAHIRWCRQSVHGRSGEYSAVGCRSIPELWTNVLFFISIYRYPRLSNLCWEVQRMLSIICFTPPMASSRWESKASRWHQKMPLWGHTKWVYRSRLIWDHHSIDLSFIRRIPTLPNSRPCNTRYSRRVSWKF